MTSAFQVRTAEQAPPKYDYAVWDGTPTSQAEVTALLKRTLWSQADQIVTSVNLDGDLVFTAPYFKFVVPAGAYLVLGPYWGGELWGLPGMGACPYEWVNPVLFANRFPST